MGSAWMFHSTNMPLQIPQTFTSEEHAAPSSPKKLILFAWLIEGVAVSVSASLAIQPLIAADTPLIVRWLGAAPFLVIAFAEMAKIPIGECVSQSNRLHSRTRTS